MIRSLVIFSLAAVTVWGQTQNTAPTPEKSPTPAATPTPSPTTAPASTPQSATPTSPGTLPTPKPPSATPDTAALVPATAPVITVQGVCSTTTPRRSAAGAAAKKTAATPSTTGPCETIVTKAQFEKIVDALNSGNQQIPPAMRRNLAQAYAELLAYAQAADKAGLEKDPKFTELMRLLRLRTLADFYRRTLEEKYRHPSDQEIQNYYDQNLPKYEEIKLSRIFIPAKNPANSDKDDWEKKAQQTANDLRERAAKGEDLEKLQKEAYTTLGLTISPPSTTVGTRRRGMLTPDEEKELFALKPGDVSKVEQEPAGYIIYKVESKQTLPLAQVKDEISRELFRQKMEAQMKAVNANIKTEFNDKYFGAASAAPPRITPRPQLPPGAEENRPRPAPPATSNPAPATPPQGQAPPK